KASKYDQIRTVSAISNVAEFLNVPVGTLTLTAKAFKLDPATNPGTPVVAIAAKDITIESGAVATAKLKLQAPGPVVSGLQPQAGGEDAPIYVRGDYFGTTEAYNVFVGGKRLPNPFRQSSSSIEIRVPAWATQSTVVVDIQSGNATQSAVSPVNLSRLASIDIGTTSITILKGATMSLSPKGTDTEGKVWNPIEVAWTVNSGNDHVNHDHGPGDPHAVAPLQVSSSNVLLAVLEGDHHIMARNGKVLATCSVKVVLPSQVVAKSVTFIEGVPASKALTLFAPAQSGDSQSATYPSTVSLKAEVVDNTAVKSNSVKWSVNPSSIATVSVSGALTTTAAGTASVTATSNDGNASNAFTLTVKSEGSLKFNVDNIPGTAHVIRLVVKNASGFTSTLDSTTAEKSRTFDNVPTGQMTIEAKAYDNPNPDNPGTKMVASGTATFTIRPGTLLTTTLNLTAAP
ncbi:MAG: Ig-like domain-containing protein, partial [Candidatus Sericytochromatia bacterium]|nr:Ig-like domain-containing protein [Candidatus Tanganyikabacteria bacterium]